MEEKQKLISAYNVLVQAAKNSNGNGDYHLAIREAADVLADKLNSLYTAEIKPVENKEEEDEQLRKSE